MLQKENEENIEKVGEFESKINHIVENELHNSSSMEEENC